MRLVVLPLSAGVGAFHRDNTRGHDAVIQELLRGVSLKCLEDIPRAEMEPHGILSGRLRHDRPVIARERETSRFPRRPVPQSLFVQCQLSAHAHTSVMIVAFMIHDVRLKYTAILAENLAKIVFLQSAF